MKVSILIENQGLRSLEFLCEFYKDHDLRIVSDFNLLDHDSDLIINRLHGMNYRDDDLDYLIESKLPCLNDPEMTKVFRDKFLQYSFLRELGLNTLRTSRDISSFEVPFVLKTLRGMKGLGVYLIKEREQLKDIIGSDNRFIAQDYIDDQIEYRYVYFLGANFLFKKSSKEFKKNLSHQIDFKTLDLIADQTAFFEMLHPKLKLNFYALDFFIIQNKITIFDINTTPGVQLLQKSLKLSDLINCQEFLPRN